MLKDAGREPSPELVAELVRAKMPLYLERARRELKGFDGAAELVRSQAERGPVLVVSGALRAEIELGLNWLGVFEHICFIVAAEDTRASKPDPEGYLIAVNWLQKQGHTELLSDAIVFEDSLAGIESAKAAGLTCVAIGHSYPMDRLQASAADLVVNNIGQISPTLLSELHAKSSS
jgi:HAD superfamily hydrolase (TIGR01509 family)